MTITALKPGNKYRFHSELITFEKTIYRGYERRHVFIVPSFRGMDGPKDNGEGHFSDRQVNQLIDEVKLRGEAKEAA